MKKTLIVFVLALLVFGVTNTNAQETPTETVPVAPKEQKSFSIDENGELIENVSPVLDFEKETHDFGEVGEGPKIEHEFKFVNTGQEPLIISKVKASCGCTTPIWPEEPVMPGEEAVIKAVYNTKKRIGPFSKAVTIYSNATTPTKRLYIKGKVLKEKPIQEEETMPVKPKSIIEK